MDPLHQAIEEATDIAIATSGVDLPNGTNPDNRPLAWNVTILRDAKSQSRVCTWVDIIAVDFLNVASEQDKEKLRANLIKLAGEALAWASQLD